MTQKKKKKKFNSPLLINLGGLLGAQLIRGWMRTLEYKCAYYDPTVDPVHPDYSGEKIYIFWHEYILFPIYLRGHCNLAMLLSQHTDADMLSRTAHHLGFEFVRGSTRRGGAAGLRGMLRKSEDMNLTITPDGPRGPRRTLAQGAIYLSSKLGMPIVAMGFGYDRPWRAPTWDRFAVPRPFSRARAVVSPPLSIPPGLNSDGIEHYRQRVEKLLQRLTDEAEAWAAAGTRKVQETPLKRQHAAHSRRRHDAAHELAGPHKLVLPVAGTGIASGTRADVA